MGSRARLYAIKYPADGSAEGTFEVFSNGHAFGGGHRPPAQISNKAEGAGLRKDDFSRISRSRRGSCTST